MKLVRFGDLCKLQNGRAFKPEEWSEKGTPIVRIQNLNNENKPFNYCSFDVEKRFWIDSGDLLFSWSGTPGTSFGAFFWNRGKGFLNQHIFRVDVKEELVDKQYLRYALNSLIIKIIDQAHGGVGLKHITKAKLEEVQIPLLPLPEQRRIASILDKADELRLKRQQAIEKLDQLLQATFIDMFGDPEQNPKKWNKVVLGDICDPKDRVNYGVVQPGNDFEGGIPLIRVGDIDGGLLSFTSIKRIDPKIEKDYSRSRIKGNEILVSCVGSIGTIAKVPNEAIGFNIARAITRVPLQDKRIINFVAECLKTEAIQNYFKKNTRTVSQPTLNVSFVKETEIIFPNEEKILDFCQIVDRVEFEKELLLKALVVQENLFQSLQNQAFSGTL